MIGPDSYLAGFVVGQDPGLDCDIGNYTGIGKNLYIHSNDNWGCIDYPNYVANYPFGNNMPSLTNTGNTKGKVVIGSDVWIGEDVKILNGVHIGDGARVAAHSVISKDVPPYAMVSGNPARIRYMRFNNETIEKLLKIKWWEWDKDRIKERLDEFKDVNSFVEKYYALL